MSNSSPDIGSVRASSLRYWALSSTDYEYLQAKLSEISALPLASSLVCQYLHVQGSFS